MNALTTNGRSYGLRVDLETFGDAVGYAKYSSFWIGPESDDYKMHVSGYSGTAGKCINSLGAGLNL